MKMIQCHILLTLIFICTGICGASENLAGIVKSIKGTNTIVRNGQEIAADPGLRLLEADTVQTGPQGALAIIFKDDTVLSLGPNSVLVIDEFLFSPHRGKLSIITRMIKGTAVYLSGIIAKLSPESAIFKTPDASLGIRGTKFLVEVKE